MKKTTIYLIYDLSVRLTDVNVDIINEENGTSYPYGITYQNLYDSRNTQRGYYKEKGGSWFVWVLPTLKGAIDLTGTSSDVIIEVSKEEYKSVHLPTYDVDVFEW